MYYKAPHTTESQVPEDVSSNIESSSQSKPKKGMLVHHLEADMLLSFVSSLPYDFSNNMISRQSIKIESEEGSGA
jgi:hypothetical protein